jgi:hypothetical protein
MKQTGPRASLLIHWVEGIRKKSERILEADMGSLRALINQV